MTQIIQEYKDLLGYFAKSGEEEALYWAHELGKKISKRNIAPEELVALHYETFQEICKGLPAEKALQIINRCYVYLVEMMTIYGLHSTSSLNFFENKHKVILDIIPSTILTVNVHGLLIFANKAAEQRSGIKASDVVGKKYIDILFDGCKKTEDGKYTSLVLETLETGKVFTDVEREYPGRGIFRVTTSVIRDKEGNIVEVIGMAHDLGPRKQLEQAAIRSEKLAAVGAMAAGIAHEIRNPLTSVRGFIQLLEPELAESKKKGYLSIILEELDRVNNVLTDFLGFAKPAPPQRQRVEVGVLLEEIHLLTGSEALLREITLNFVCPVALPRIYIDKDQMKQVFLNILKNAFDAVGPRGEVKVSAVWEPLFQNVSLIIKDNGTGMDKQTAARIFDPFFTTKESGTGLGMAVTLQIIKNHDGEIQVDSIPGYGTTFTITLPV